MSDSVFGKTIQTPRKRVDPNFIDYGDSLVIWA